MLQNLWETLKNECGLCQKSELFTITGLVHRFLVVFCFTNLIIWLKALVHTEDADKSRSYKSIITSCYILGKWLLIICFMVFSINNTLSTIIAWYLLWSNLFMYVFFHAFFGNTWDCNKKSNNSDTRFIYAILAFGFNLLVFSYLYAYPYHNYFTWISEKNNIDLHKTPLKLIVNSIYLSFSGAFTLTLGDIPKPNIYGKILLMLELITTFIFITIIIGNTLPSTKTNINKE